MRTPDKGRAYRQLWRVVDGAVRDALDHHPDYLTAKGRRNARESVTKRVTGQVLSYATQVAEGRSGSSPAPEMKGRPKCLPFVRPLLSRLLGWRLWNRQPDHPAPHRRN